MLTPQEVSEHAFAKASFGGYNMAMVDEFLDVLTVDYTTLYKENTTLKAKMKVLVDKVEEYRSTEDAMRKALLTAQKMADDLVAEAERKKQTIIQSAQEDAHTRVADLRHEMEAEQTRLAAAQASTASYVAKLKEICQHEMEYLNGLARVVEAPKTAEPAPAADPVVAAALDIETCMGRILDTAESTPTTKVTGLYAELLELKGAAAETVPSSGSGDSDDTEVDDTSPTRRIDFDHLQFGRDYEIT